MAPEWCYVDEVTRRDGSDGDPSPDLVTSLSRVVEREANRVLSERQLRPDPALVAQGWERRFVTDARRAEEAVQLYRELGYEVRAEPVQREEAEEGCEDCQLVMLLEFRTIYTRRPWQSAKESS